MTLFGIDVSSAQHGIDTGAVPSDIVMIKLTGGTGYVNPDFDAELAKAKADNKGVLAYHFYHEEYLEGTPDQEAQFFLSHVMPYLDGTVGVALDYEPTPTGRFNALDPAQSKAWCDIVHAQSGVVPWGYGPVSTIGAGLRSVSDAGYPIWAAAYTLGYQPIYGYTPPVGPLGVPAGMNVKMWQFTSSGHLPNWPNELDLNIFYGTRAEFDALCAVGGAINPQGYKPTPPSEDDGMSQAEVLEIQGFIDTLQTELQKSVGEVTQQLIQDQIRDLTAHVDASIQAALFASEKFDQKAGQDEGAVIINEVRANANMLVAIAAKNAPAVAAAIPADIAQAVADELAKRLTETK
ncbi:MULTISPECIES: GH25 family lysozyme [Arthrobacter]|uniref:Lysozyme n=1 Tax=Arthrobacter terricola TaxID=2547396 RepID=A0A4V2ZTE8_9MICC|nr:MULTISPECIES: GH25 family lysozyme [Arthrobacter]MBT8160971.1 hypothetical protein [Arthrobacter sp. GN70]TDF96834.1 hypothetical protein E1809_08920 [Arthrobacter terricola]